MTELFQDRLKDEPFWMLVACILVNRTRWSQAKPILEELRSRWPTPGSLSRANLRVLRAAVEPLGFGLQRSWRLSGLARLWFEVGPPTTARSVLAYPGCGRYAADSWAIFVDGDLSVEPTDRELRKRLAELREAR